MTALLHMLFHIFHDFRAHLLKLLVNVSQSTNVDVILIVILCAVSFPPSRQDKKEDITTVPFIQTDLSAKALYGKLIVV